MTPEFLDRSVVPEHSYAVTHYKDRHFFDKWHYHEQYEIVAISKSTGTRFVGDSIERFTPGQLVILGGNLPHMWKNDKEYFEGDGSLEAEAVSIHLGKNLTDSETFHLPEFASVKNLLKKSSRGILIQDHDVITQKMKDLPGLQGFEQFLAVLEILNLFGKEKKYQLLASEGYLMNTDNTSMRLQKVHQYIMNHFKERIQLKEAADLIHMNPSAFSRFFSNLHQKSFTSYVNEIRIGFARKLLIEGQMSITEICYECGFRNASNFNRQFRKLNGMAPTEYRASYGVM